MKIAIVFDAFGYGGAEVIGANYARMMNEMGHDVTVINLTPKQSEMQTRLAEGVKYVGHHFSQYWCGDYYYILLKAFRWGKYAFPLIYLSLSIVGFFHSLFSRYYFSKFDLAIAFAGHINDMNFVGRNYLRTRHRICWFHGAVFQKFLYSSAYVYLCNKMDEVVVLNEECQEQTFTANHFMKRFKIKKLYNPIYMTADEINENNVEQYKKEYGKFLVMSARLAYPHKDHYTVIAALEILRKKYNLDLNLVLLGNGPEREKLVKFATEHNVIDNVIFRGNVDNVQDYYKASFALVHASVAGEGLPTILLEAMVCGTPVVATDSTVGPREIIGNDENGLLCKVKDPEGMAAAIKRLYEDKNLYEHIVNAGYKRIKDFDPEIIKKQFSELLESFK